MQEFIPLLVVFVIIGIPIICFTLYKIAKILKGTDSLDPKSPGAATSDEPRLTASKEAEETRLIQEINRTLGRLETRIEALETIVLDRERNKKGTSDHA